MRCKRVVETERVNPRFGGPEYETVSTFGAYCGVDDLDAVAYANQLCNLYGMDTISCGATIAWAMDAYERGFLLAEDTNGIDLKFGNAEAMVAMVEQIARREGFGDILAKGSAEAAKIIGRGTEELLATARNKKPPPHAPRQALAGINLRGQPIRSRPSIQRTRPSYNWYPKRMTEIG